ncbi:MAG TPA: GatB/YqeY domain-containing protein [Candidatus Paceibacterota bacterium]|nr:GatB/YqeY domain-containing protein [Candidatus Paceibacterota bacterium]
MLKDTLNKDLVEALKANDELKTGTLRLILSALHNLEIEKRSKTGKSVELTDDDVLEVLKREVRKRKEAIDLYTKGNRADLAAKEESELKFIAIYLPPEMGEEEVRKEVAAVLLRVKPVGPADFGRVMGEAMKVLKGKADASLVSKIIKEHLEK